MKSDLVQAFELMVYFTVEQSGITKPAINRILDPKLFEEMVNYNPEGYKEPEKYFKPTIEDIRVGYECECTWCCPEEWISINITEKDYEEYAQLSVEDAISQLLENQIRTLYLTTEQIEKEGWKFVHQGLLDTFQMFEMGHNLYMTFYNQQRTITIVKGNGYFLGTKGNTIYNGKCPSINEFRTIMKLLNIK